MFNSVQCYKENNIDIGAFGKKNIVLKGNFNIFRLVVCANVSSLFYLEKNDKHANISQFSTDGFIDYADVRSETFPSSFTLLLSGSSFAAYVRTTFLFILLTQLFLKSENSHTLKFYLV